MPKKKRPRKSKKSRTTDPATRLYRWTQRHQRTSFLGTLKYRRLRKPKGTIMKILKICLEASLRKRPVALADVETFLNERQQLFLQDCRTDWRLHASAGDQVFDLLKLAGYQGTIDDLWVSVYGMKKPSKATAFIVPSETANPLKPRPGFFWTGQTRKPGSHKS